MCAAAKHDAVDIEVSASVRMRSVGGYESDESTTWTLIPPSSRESGGKKTVPTRWVCQRCLDI